MKTWVCPFSEGLKGGIVHSEPEVVGSVEAPARKEHELKCWPEYFAAIVDGSKPFEVRLNDRDFGVWDVLHLREWEPRTERYTGREGRWVVTYLLTGGHAGIEPGYVVLGLNR